jgi:hypothetical protein
MKKSGQVTVFIIIGLLIIIILGLTLYYSKILNNPKNNIDDNNLYGNNEANFDSYVKSCLKLVSNDVIISTIKNGGIVKPNDFIQYKNKEYSVVAIYDSKLNIKPLFFKNLENDLSNEIKINLDVCIKSSYFKNQGYEVIFQTKKVKSTIEDEFISVELNFPVTLKKGKKVKNYDIFTEQINLPLGIFHKAGIDILNSEAVNGFFDKEKFMLKNGFIINKHKPYPNTIYEIKLVDEKYKNENITYKFAIKGKDTAGKEIINVEQKGCCKSDKLCIQNVKNEECSFDYNANCFCLQNTNDNNFGCCFENQKCDITNQKNCNGQFFENDYKCKIPTCSNLDCENSFDYTTNSFSGMPRKNGESWCTFEGPVSNGFDYVGSRHFLFSCIKGDIFIEEARDYREEFCIEWISKTNGENFSKANVKLNRWYDCSMQNSQMACENRDYRDCVWSEYLDLFTNKKCHPTVSPGLKFWSEGTEICSIASLNQPSINPSDKEKWSYSALLYCQKSGDCGNYRNIANDITKFGYYNRDGEPDEWVYLDENLYVEGDLFYIDASFSKTKLKNILTMPTGNLGSSDSTCGVWGPPNIDKCDLCDAVSLFPCSEYRCKSLGKSCIFKNETSKCVKEGTNDLVPPKITLTEIFPLSYLSENDLVYGGIKYMVQEKLELRKPLNIKFTTDEPTRCQISMFPPNFYNQLLQSSLNLPKIFLNEDGYKKSYSFDIRLPSKNFSSKNEYQLFLICYDESGNINDEMKSIEINTKENINPVEGPKVLDIVNYYDRNYLIVDSPFNGCKYSTSRIPYEDMTLLNCNTQESNIIYKAGLPLGSFLCLDEITSASTTIYATCKDDNLIGEIQEIIINS